MTIYHARAHEVRAFLNGTKTRVTVPLKAQTELPHFDGVLNGEAIFVDSYGSSCVIRLPFASGDTILVKEAFSYDRLDVDRDGILPPWFWADGNPEHGDWTRPKSSAVMPAWAVRIKPVVTDVRVCRVMELGEDEARAHGIFERSAIGDDPVHSTWTWQPTGWRYATPRQAFAAMWTDRYGPDAYERNPWVASATVKMETM